MHVDAPTPTAAPNAAERFIKGNVKASPEMAIAPTPCPIKMLSTMLYSEDAVMATMAGSEYCSNSRPTGFVPSSRVACRFSFSILLRVQMLCGVLRQAVSLCCPTSVSYYAKVLKKNDKNLLAGAF